MFIIQLRQVNPEYLNFLRQFDPKVMEKSGRPWLWPVSVDGLTYGIPLTTQESGAGFAGYLRSGMNPDSGIYFKYMMPVPEKALMPPKPMPDDLKAELKYFEENRKYIEAEAQILYRLSELGQMDKTWRQHSCNFQELNSVYYYWKPGFDSGLFLLEDENMPISRNGKPFYTPEQYEQAMYNSNALEYAQAQGYDLVQQGSFYKMKEHDSMVFTPQGRWFWNSRGVHGGALEFMIYYEGRTIVDAVLTLVNDPEYTKARPQERSAAQPAKQPAAEKPAAPTYTFKLPDKANNMSRMFYYLCAERGLDKSVMKEMIDQGRLYQSVYSRGDGKAFYNATFVYKDLKGNAIGAYQRGIRDVSGQIPYKRDVPGSDKSWGWLLQGTGKIHTLCVYEGAIDAASEASLLAMKGKPWQEGIDRLSLEGVSYQPLQNYLKVRTDVRNIVLMLDGDEAGRNATKTITESLKQDFPGIQIEDRLPLYGKDWNETLCEMRTIEAENTQEISEPEI